MESALKNGTHMSLYNDGEVRQYLTDRYAAELQARGLPPDQISDDLDLLNEGIIDSMGIMELVTDIESHFGHPIDFEELDAEQMTILGPLIAHINRKLIEVREGASAGINRLAGLPVGRLLLKGKAVQVWLALDERATRQGLMGIEASELAPLTDGTERGMLFVLPNERPLSFWMFKTLVPLDIAYMDASRRIINWHSAKPLETRLLYPSARPAQYVLEVNANLLQRWGIEPDDVVELPLLPQPTSVGR